MLMKVMKHFYKGLKPGEIIELCSSTRKNSSLETWNEIPAIVLHINIFRGIIYGLGPLQVPISFSKYLYPPS